MTYSAYINKDYKTVVTRTPTKRQRLTKLGVWVISIGLCIGLAMQFMPTTKVPITDKIATVNPTNRIVSQPKQASGSTALYSTTNDSTEEIIPVAEEPPTPAWETIIVKQGDNLSLIFDRLDLSPQLLYQVISLNGKTNALKHLLPGQELRFQISEGQLHKLEYDINLTNSLQISKIDDQYSAETIISELETRINEANGVIDSSLFLAAQSSGLSDNLTMQLIELYGWDIDFALDIRKGDYFHVIYEEHFKDNVKVRDGPILVVEFTNQSNTFRAVRYTHTDGHSDYYSDLGHSMRKAFLRTPVNFSRISSRFNLRRKHPVLNKIRAHKGVDYAAPPGTVIKAAGDGIVKLAGKKGGYGKVVILKHGEKYSTLYGHMSSFARGIKKGTRVKQGQTIGYVGMTGLATGPHLHYEFRINGVHRNPLTVKLPKALKIPDAIMDDFKTQTEPLLAQLDNFIQQSIKFTELVDNTPPEKIATVHTDLNNSNKIH